MSPSWHRRLFVGLAPQEVSLLRFGRGLRPRLEEAALIPIAVVSGPMVWKPLIDALSEYLGEKESGLRAHIVLSNHFVRYAVFPANTQLHSEAERLALATTLIEDRYGASSRDWAIRVSSSQDHAAALISAVPRPLLEDLLSVCASKVLVSAVRPLLMEMANRVCPHSTDGHLMLVMAEQGRITLAHARNGAWLAITSRSIADDEESALSRILAEDAEMAVAEAANECWLDDLTGPIKGKEAKVRCREIHIQEVAGAPPCLALRGVA